MLSAFRRLCVAREKSEDQQRLEQEMDKAQIEQMRQLSAGGMGAAPTEKEDDPAVLIKLAYRLVQVSTTLPHAPTTTLSQPPTTTLSQPPTTTLPPAPCCSLLIPFDAC